jgi:hypothetical protein
MTNFAVFELCVLLSGAGLTAALIVLRACLPGLAARADAAVETRSANRRFLLGLLNGPALFFLAAALGSRPEGKPVSLVLLALLAGLALWGFLAVAPQLGRRILATAQPEASILAHTLWGTAALPVPFLLPVAGWPRFAALLLLAVGTGVSALFTRQP